MTINELRYRFPFEPRANGKSGINVDLFIEDQPLVRGSVIKETFGVLVDTGALLPINDYTYNNFGDTHSLMLIVDSLNIQNTRLEWNETESQHQAADAGIPFRFNPADRVGQEEPGSEFCNPLISGMCVNADCKKPFLGGALSLLAGGGVVRLRRIPLRGTSLRLSCGLVAALSPAYGLPRLISIDR